MLEPFTLHIKVNAGILHLTFYKIFTVKGDKFFVTVRNGTHYLLFDMMKNDTGQWRFISTSQLWAQEIECELSDAIIANLK